MASAWPVSVNFLLKALNVFQHYDVLQTFIIYFHNYKKCMFLVYFQQPLSWHGSSPWGRYSDALRRRRRRRWASQPARQQWTMANFQFLLAHLWIWANHSQLGRMHTPVLPVDPEGEDEGGDDDDATSVTSSQAPSQLPSSSQYNELSPADSYPQPLINET